LVTGPNRGPTERGGRWEIFPHLILMMMMMFIGTETLVTQLVYESSGMHADRTTRELEEMTK